MTQPGWILASSGPTIRKAETVYMALGVTFSNEDDAINLIPLLLKYIDHIAEKWGESEIPHHVYKLKKDAQKNDQP